MRERGFTFIEVLIATGIFMVVMAGATMAVSQDAKSLRVIGGHLGPEMKARSALDRVASELRMASVWAEDRNHNQVLDDGEDTNENGTLESHWSLQEGGGPASFITFNKRMDAVDEDGNVVGSGVYSGPVSYRLEGERMVRVWNTQLAPGVVVTRRSTVATGVLALRFERSAEIVTISIDVRLPPRIYKSDRRTLSTRVWLRN